MARKSPPILVFQHTPTEPLGRLEESLRSEGAELHVYHHGYHEPPTADVTRAFGAIVSLGGPMSANDHATDPFLAGELEVMRKALSEDTAILGISLGAHLLALALGGTVLPLEGGPEIGWDAITLSPKAKLDPLIKGFGPTETVFHWHRETVTVPRDARPLASSKRCPAQAFAYGGAYLGLQFHVQADARMADGWASAPEAAEDLRAAKTDLATISDSSLRHGGRATALAKVIGKRFALMAAGLRADQSGAIRI